MGDLKARGFNCRNCGAPVTLRGLSWTQTVTCPSCDAIQDPNDPNLLVLQEAERRQRVRPLIPLGTRGTIDGRHVEVIGFQYRTIQVEGETGPPNPPGSASAAAAAGAASGRHGHRKHHH